MGLSWSGPAMQPLSSRAAPPTPAMHSDRLIVPPCRTAAPSPRAIGPDEVSPWRGGDMPSGGRRVKAGSRAAGSPLLVWPRANMVQVKVAGPPDGAGRRSVGARTVMGIYDREYYRREGQGFLGGLT